MSVSRTTGRGKPAPGGGPLGLTYGVFSKLSSSETGKRIKNNVVPLLGLVLIGTLFSMGTPAIPFLGIPPINAPWLGMAFVFWGVLYVFPSEAEVMRKAREENTTYTCYDRNGNNAGAAPGGKCTHGVAARHTVKATSLELKTENWGPLYARGMIKVLAVASAMADLARLNLLIALIFAFVMYFRMPGSYKRDQPYKAAEAWLRTIIGLAMAIMLTIYLSPNANVDFGLMLGGPAFLIVAMFFILVVVTSMAKLPKWAITIAGLVLCIFMVTSGIASGLSATPQASLLFLALAFYAVTPVREAKSAFQKRSEMQIVISGAGGGAAGISDWMDKQQKKWDDLGTGVFIAFMLIGGIPIMGSWLAGSGTLRATTTAVWFLSLFTGIIGGREARPYVGSVMMLFAIIAFTSAYSTTVGTAVFGQYWGTVQSGTESVLGPINEAAERGSCQAAASYSCITEGPVVCAEEKLRCDRTEAQAVGTDRSIQFEEIKSAPPEYDPNTDATISYVFTNAGEYDARNVELSIPSGNPYPNVTRVVGVEEKGGGQNIGGIEMDEGSCIGGEYKGENKCSWSGDLKPGARGAGLITVKWVKSKMKLSCNEDEACDRGLYPWILFRTSYDYTVRATYAIDVRSKDELQRILLGGESIAGTIGQYSGGPITAALWTPKYIQSGTSTLVTASLTNTKNGVAKNAIFCIYVPEQAELSGFSGGDVVLENGQISFNGKAREDTGEYTECTHVDGAKAVTCGWISINPATNVDPQTAKPRNSKTCSFKLKLDISPAPQKQLAIVGKADFRYQLDTYKKDVPIIFASEMFR
jgi:hypothetical protein